MYMEDIYEIYNTIREPLILWTYQCWRDIWNITYHVLRIIILGPTLFQLAWPASARSVARQCTQRGPSVHAAILDTNTKQSDVFILRLFRLMYMVESEDIHFLNLNSHLITYDDINSQVAIHFK